MDTPSSYRIHLVSFKSFETVFFLLLNTITQEYKTSFFMVPRREKLQSQKNDRL